MKNKIRELKNFYILWSTQSLSQLGSTMTSFALTLWLYQKNGSALQTALLSICSYSPYVILSIFAVAFLSLLLLVNIPETAKATEDETQESKWYAFD